MIGHVAFWTLEGEADPSLLPNPPPLPSPLTALRRALKHHARTLPNHVRMLPPRPVASASVPSLAIVLETDENGTLSHSTTEIHFIDPVTNLPNHSYLHSTYLYYSSRLTADDVRPWLANRLAHLGRMIRDGVYFCPTDPAPLAQTLRHAMPRARLHTIQAADASPDAIEALVAMLAEETRNLESEASSSLRASAKRQARLDAQLTRLAAFETALQTPLASLRAIVEGAKTTLSLKDL